MYGIRFEYRGKVFPMPSAEAALEIAGERAEALVKKGRSWVKLDPTREGKASHRPDIVRDSRGRGAVAGQTTAYATVVRCSCREFRSKSNEAPTKGGRQIVEDAFARHLVEVAEAL